jgi:hypothetical protein
MKEKDCIFSSCADTTKAATDAAIARSGKAVPPAQPQSILSEQFWYTTFVAAQVIFWFLWPMI